MSDVILISFFSILSDSFDLAPLLTQINNHSNRSQECEMEVSACLSTTLRAVSVLSVTEIIQSG